MIVTSAQYVKNKQTQVVNGENTNVSFGDNVAITAVIDGQTLDYIPLDPDNRHYAEIMRQVEAGTLTIQDAE